MLPEFPVDQRATATALWTATGAVAAATGPSLGGVLVSWQGWRAVFFVNLLIGLPTLIPASRLLRESRDPGAGRWPDAVGSLLLALGVGTVALAIIKGPEWGWASNRVIVTFAAAALLLALFLVRSANHPAPVIELGLFRVRSFTVASAGGFVFSIGFFALLLCNVLFLTTVWHYSILGAGMALTPGPIAAAVMAPLAGRVADRFGQRSITVPGSLLFAAGAVLYVLRTTAAVDYWATFLPPALLAGIGIGLVIPGFGSAAVAELPRPRFATGVAITSCFRQIGGCRHRRADRGSRLSQGRRPPVPVPPILGGGGTRRNRVRRDRTRTRPGPRAAGRCPARTAASARHLEAAKGIIMTADSIQDIAAPQTSPGRLEALVGPQLNPFKFV